MSVIYKVITRPTDPRVPNSPKRYYPHLITCLLYTSLFYALSPINQVSLLLHCPTGVREYGVKPR